MRNLCTLVLALALGACVTTHDRTKEMSDLNAGKTAIVYGGAYENLWLFDKVIGVQEGDMIFDNRDPKAPGADFRRSIPSEKKTYMGYMSFPPGEWQMHTIQMTMSRRIELQSQNWPILELKPGEVVYIGQYEVQDPNRNYLGLDFMKQRALVRRDDFEKFREQLRASEPELAERIVYRPLRSPGIYDKSLLP
jgi:hypothetical protein